MPRFEILADTAVIGYSELEDGDPPMGVAIGRFFPLSAYEAIQPKVVSARSSAQKNLGLSVRSADGIVIPAQGGVIINDYSAELGPDDVTVEVLGIGYPLYEQLFPGRHAQYVAGFRNKT